jgi:hypothetical protein
VRVFGTPQASACRYPAKPPRLTAGARPIGEQIGLGPNAKTHRWSIQKALRQVAVGAALLGTMIGGGNVAYAQVGANLNVVPGATISVNSNFGQVQAGKPVVVDGIQSGAPMNASSTTSRFQPDASFDTYTSSADQAVERAFIRTTAEAIPGGAQHHGQLLPQGEGRQGHLVADGRGPRPLQQPVPHHHLGHPGPQLPDQPGELPRQRGLRSQV